MSINNRQSSIDPDSAFRIPYSAILLVCCLLALFLTGCAKKVTNNNPGQTLNITVSFAANVDTANYRYFLILNHDNANQQGPDLSGKRTYTLNFDGNVTPGGSSPGLLDASSAPSFIYTDFFELSGSPSVSTHGAGGNSAVPGFSSNNFVSGLDPSISISVSGVNITFSIPFDPLIQYFQIQLVSAGNDYVIADILDLGTNRTGYHWIPNSRGYFESITAADGTPLGILPKADIRGCTITIN